MSLVLHVLPFMNTQLKYILPIILDARCASPVRCESSVCFCQLAYSRGLRNEVKEKDMKEAGANTKEGNEHERQNLMSINNGTGNDRSLHCL